MKFEPFWWVTGLPAAAFEEYCRQYGNPANRIRLMERTQRRMDADDALGDPLPTLSAFAKIRDWPKFSGVRPISGG